MYNADYEKAQLNNAINTANMAQAQAKAQYADMCQTQAASGVCAGRPATLSEQLQKTAEGSYQQGRDFDRAANILRKHPEFEDFIWLIRSGLI